MFGGFPEAFFSTYFEHNPKTEPVEEFPMRCQLYESFHYLNHTLIFGVRDMNLLNGFSWVNTGYQGHYGQHAEKMMVDLLEEMRKRWKEKQTKSDTEAGQELFAESHKAVGVN